MLEHPAEPPAEPGPLRRQPAAGPSLHQTFLVLFSFSDLIFQRLGPVHLRCREEPRVHARVHLLQDCVVD